jgi:PAS domain S-box-containing protein
MSLQTPTPPSSRTSTYPLVRKRFQNPILQTPRIVLDEDGTVREVSTSALRMLDYRSQSAMNPSFFSYVHGKNLYQVMRDVADMVCYGKPRATWLLRLRTGDGRWRWFKVNAQISEDNDERMIELILRDVSDW